MSFVQSGFSRRWREAVLCAVAVVMFLTVSIVGVSQETGNSAGETKAPAAAATGGAKKGEQIFKTRCIICHNKQPGDDSPFGPPNLFEAFKKKAVTPPQAEQIITKGKGQMPAFGSILSKSEMQSVIAYLKAGK